MPRTLTTIKGIRVRGLDERHSPPAALLQSAPVHLHADLAGERVLRRIGSICLRHLIRNEAAARAADAEGIHQMRVAVRRLRAIIATFGPMLPHGVKAEASSELRWFADVLGAARNLDVLVSELIAPAPASIAGASEFQRLVRAVERRRLMAHEAALEAIMSDRYKASINATRDWFHRCEWRGYDEGEVLKRPIGELAPVLLERGFRRVKKRAKHFRTQSETQRHELRIAIKKLRYAADPLTSIYPSKKSAAFVRQLKRLQDELGLINDLSAARGIVASMVDQGTPLVGIGNAASRLFGWHERRLVAREPKLRRHLQSLLASERPWLSETCPDKPAIRTEQRYSLVERDSTLIQTAGCVSDIGTSLVEPSPARSGKASEMAHLVSGI